MPTRIHNPNLSTRERYFARQATYRLASRTKLVETLQAPWMGWVPDLPPHIAGYRGCQDCRGLIAAPYLGRGLYLRHDDGFEQIDAANLPLSTGAYAITGLAQYRDVDQLNVMVPMAITAGAAGVDNVFARGNGGTWTAIAANAGITPPELDRETTWDHCVFPYGCPTRTGGNLTWPVVVFCGSDDSGPTSQVLVYPDNTGAPRRYDELIDAAELPGGTFRAASCETFNGRVHFFNTIESGDGTQATRHRWSAVGTAYPYEAIVGSGYMDFAESQRQGRRIAAMRDHLVLYFEDGTAFQVPTGFYADAYRPQLISGSRGLLGTQAMCVISPHLHFGIFNDGWWTLDSSGRWSEVGRIVLEETRGKSHELTKWKSSFYEDLDFSQKHRICCTYDNYRKMVRIAYPSKTTQSENYTILNYHWPTDSCWKDRYAKPVTAWGKYDIQTAAGEQWDAATETWDTYPSYWDDNAPQYREEVVVHGCGLQTVGGGLDAGYVFARDPSLQTYDGQTQSFYYSTFLMNRNKNPMNRQTFHKLGIEYMSVGTPAMVAVVTTDEGTEFQVQAVNVGETPLRSINSSNAYFRLEGSEHGFTLQGTTPIAIRSITAELMLYGGDDPEGQ